MKNFDTEISLNIHLELEMIKRVKDKAEKRQIKKDRLRNLPLQHAFKYLL